MDNDNCRNLIQLYESKELLWNAKNGNNHNTYLREDALQEISDSICISVDDLLAKHRREKSSI